MASRFAWTPTSGSWWSLNPTRLFLQSSPKPSRSKLLPRWPILALFALFFLAWGLDGLNSYLTLFPGLPHLYEPYNNLRLLTGTLQGLALSLVLWPVAAFTFWRQSKPVRIVSPLELSILLGVALAVVWLVAGGAPVVLYAAGLLSTLGLVSLFVLLNTLLLTVVLGREGTFDRFSQVLPLLAAALLLATIELVLLSLLRHLILGF